MGQADHRRFSLERWTIRVVPALGMATIAASALLMTEPEPRWAQIFAGPTDHAGKMAWRLAVKHGSFERQFPSAANLNFEVIFTDNSAVRKVVALDGDGLAWVMFERPAFGLAEPLRVTVREGSRILATGPIFVSERQWKKGQRVEGGWCSGHSEGDREIKLGVVNGLVLHSLPADLIVTLSEHGQPLPRKTFTVTADGAEIVGGKGIGKVPPTAPSEDFITDEHGVGHITVRTTDLAATVRVTSGSPRASSFVGALPIRSGGLGVARNASALVITSPIGLERASVGRLTVNGLVDVRTVALVRTGNVTAGAIDYASWPQEPLWAMVSSEAELDAGNTIGWPLLDRANVSQAHPSVVIPNQLVLDGYPTVKARLEKQRQRAWTIASIALVLVGILLAWAVVRSNRRTQHDVKALDRWLERGSASSIAERAPYALIAVVVLTAATVALTWWLSLSH